MVDTMFTAYDSTEYLAKKENLEEEKREKGAIWKS